MQLSERLIDLLNRLAPGSLLCSTPELELVLDRPLAHVSIFEASRAILDAGYQDQKAELSDDGQIISISTGERLLSWPAFTIDQEGKPSVIAHKNLMGQDHRYTAQVDATGTLTISERTGDTQRELQLPAQAARALANFLRRQVVRDATQHTHTTVMTHEQKKV